MNIATDKRWWITLNIYPKWWFKTINNVDGDGDDNNSLWHWQTPPCMFSRSGVESPRLKIKYWNTTTFVISYKNKEISKQDISMFDQLKCLF